jgi:hypothetical protein
MNKNCTYEELMIETIADPLGMNDTRIELTERMKKNWHQATVAERSLKTGTFPLAGAGAIRSSASDMAKFISANLGYLIPHYTKQWSYHIKSDMIKPVKCRLQWGGILKKERMVM